MVRLPPRGSRGAATSTVEENDGLNAKERRRLRRQAEREAQPSLANSGDDDLTRGRGEVVRKTGLTAKERRRPRRGEERAEAERRRLETRVEPQTTQPIEPRPEPDAKALAGSKRKRRVPLVAFVGQLSFGTTAEQLETFLRDGGVPGALSVRLLTSKDTRKSRGMAFVECETPEALHACVSLHHASLDGRRINVEKSAGGGKETKKARVSEKRKKQQQTVEETVDRVVSDFEKDGRLREGEVDDGVRRLLARRSGRVAEAALSEYCSLEGREKFHNPAAYLTKIVTRMTDEDAIANKSTVVKDKKKTKKSGPPQRAKGEKES
ncbi:hypothetical protein CTAYLR_000275 [Chrysophaeum taylorii]|uniref:RRM domain-containing protein n=1 Tax=Chrysophaeum taylorii TaxID=2483200 RepID=A0AAD7XPK6_9STRA|nr:hypothetical protein CTAYLR_000275 [Chrysophaeum taylorii]